MSKNARTAVVTVAALAGLALGGSALAGAASNSGTTTTTTPAAGTAPARPPGPRWTSANAPGTRAHEDTEKPVTGAAAAKARAAALASVGGGTAGEVTGDYRNSGDYEVTVTKKDGTKVDVHLDPSFKVRAGFPGGGPGGPDGGGPGAY